MNDDIHDAITALVKSGQIDKDRVCSVGIGDGGYSALLGAATSPDRHRCAVSVNGVADLAKYIEHLKLRTWTYSTFRRWYMNLLGADATSNKALKTVSPARLAEAVQAAVLLIHDASDTISPLSQSESMAAALKRAGEQTSRRADEQTSVCNSRFHLARTITLKNPKTGSWFFRRLGLFSPRIWRLRSPRQVIETLTESMAVDHPCARRSCW